MSSPRPECGAPLHQEASVSESRPATTAYTEADRLEAQALLDEVMVGDHSHDSANAVIARALCAARAAGYDEGFRACMEQIQRERFAGWPARECDHDGGECHDARHSDPDWPYVYPCPECGGNGCAGCGGKGEREAR